MSLHQNNNYYKEYIGGSIDSLVHTYQESTNLQRSILIANSHNHSNSFQSIINVTPNIEKNTISWSISNSIHFSSRSTSSHIILKENSVVIYSGLESGHIVETTLNNNDINTKEIKLDINSPVSSISVDRYTGAMYISFDDGNLVCYHGEDAISHFQPSYGCSAIQALGNECVLVTSQHSINSACIYDQSNNNTLSISCPQQYHYFSCISVNPFNDKEIVFGCSDGSVFGYDLRNANSSLFSYQAHSKYVSSIHYYSNPYPNILSSSLDGTVYQRIYSGEGRILISERDVFSSCVLDPMLDFAAAGGESGNLVITHPI